MSWRACTPWLCCCTPRAPGARVAASRGAVARSDSAGVGRHMRTGCRCASPRPQRTNACCLEGRILSVPARDGRGDALRCRAAHSSTGPDARRAYRAAGMAGRVDPRREWVNAGACWCAWRNFPIPATSRARSRALRVSRSGASRGRVLPSRLNRRLALATASIDSARARVAARIDDQVADPDAAALLAALAVGLTDRLSADSGACSTPLARRISSRSPGCTSRCSRWWRSSCAGARGMALVMPGYARVEREPFAMVLGSPQQAPTRCWPVFLCPHSAPGSCSRCLALARLTARHAGPGAPGRSRWWPSCCSTLAPLSAGFWLSFVAVGVILL